MIVMMAVERAPITKLSVSPCDGSDGRMIALKVSSGSAIASSTIVVRKGDCMLIMADPTENVMFIGVRSM